MTDFVLEQAKFKNDTYELSHLLINYANFLKRPLTRGMFVPCDLEGNILEEPKQYKEWIELQKKRGGYSLNLDCKIFQEAKDRVLFEGFELKDLKLDSRNKCISKDNIIHVFWENSTSKEWTLSKGISIIEDLVIFNLQLTKTANHQFINKVYAKKQEP